MLRQMIRMECRKAFRNKMFYIAVAAGCIITLFALVYYIGIYQNELTMMQADDVNPMHEASGLFNFWIGGEPFSFGSAAYFFMFPLLTAFPYGWSYCGEKRSGYIRIAVVQAGKKAYFLAKYTAVFLSGALAMVIPLAFDFLLSALFFPAVMPSPVYCTSTGVFYDSLMSMLYYTVPLLYVLIYLLIDFIFGGLIACISYAAACFVRYRVVAVILPLFFMLAVHYLRQFVYISAEVRYREISPMFFLRPVQAAYPASFAVIFAEMAALFFVTFFLSVIWERKHEIY